MQQYLDLLKQIKEKGTWKEPAREGMPKTLSLFGAQFRHNLREGFPLLTTKKLSFKNIVTELLFFLRGDTNIKYLLDNGCEIWSEDAYNFYLKKCKEQKITRNLPFGLFVSYIKNANSVGELKKDSLDNSENCTPLIPKNYVLGDLGKQYGWLWRNWEKSTGSMYVGKIDQIKELIEGLKNNPMSRRHIITAWNPATLEDMALNACHCFVQFNCREIPLSQRQRMTSWQYMLPPTHEELDADGIPKYYLDCQLYQRSADVFLGVPYNIASYALLTHIIANICDMCVGDYVHTFGDVHIYENHMEQVDLQLSRKPGKLPYLKNLKSPSFWYNFDVSLFTHLDINDFKIMGYEPDSSIKAKLSTGLK